MVRKIAFVFAGLAALLLAGLAVVLVMAATSEADKRVSRSTTVNAPIETVFAQVNDLQNWSAWSPWKTMDPEMKLEYGPIRAGKDAWYSWDGEGVGTGKLTITDSAAYASIETAIDFGEMGEGSGSWSFTQEGDAVEVTWAFTSHGRHLMDKVFHLFLDGMLGPQLESGLAALKDVAESAPLPAAASDASRVD